VTQIWINVKITLLFEGKEAVFQAKLACL